MTEAGLVARHRVAALIIAAVLLGAACGSSDSEGSATTVVSNDGAELYAANCASCHGADLRGTELGPSQLSIVYEPNHHPDESFRSAVRNGVGAHHWDFGPMPPVPGLDDDEVDAIIEYIRAIQQREGFEPYPPED